MSQEKPFARFFKNGFQPRPLSLDIAMPSSSPTEALPFFHTPAPALGGAVTPPTIEEDFYPEQTPAFVIEEDPDFVGSPAQAAPVAKLDTPPEGGLELVPMDFSGIPQHWNDPMPLAPAPETVLDDFYAHRTEGFDDVNEGLAVPDTSPVGRVVEEPPISLVPEVVTSEPVELTAPQTFTAEPIRLEDFDLSMEGALDFSDPVALQTIEDAVTQAALPSLDTSFNEAAFLDTLGTSLYPPQEEVAAAPDLSLETLPVDDFEWLKEDDTQAVQDLDAAWYAPPEEFVLPELPPAPAELNVSEYQTRFSALTQEDLSRLTVLQSCPLGERALFLVEMNGAYVLTAAVRDEITVLKVFAENPLQGSPVFSADRALSLNEAHALFTTRVGCWEGVISATSEQVQIHTEMF
jgi:hypothetical protein